MTGVYLKFAVPIGFIFTVLTMLINTQPYNDRDLRAFLLAEGCPMPCFMGIRPGETTVEEAVKLLSENAWVDKVKDDPSTLAMSAITWTWSASKPGFIRAHSSGLLLSHTEAEKNIVDVVRFETTVPLGYVALLLYDEATPVILPSNGARNQPYLQITDYGLSIRLSSVLSCPITTRKIFDAAATVEYDRPKVLGIEPSGQVVNTAFYWCWRLKK